MTPAPSRSRDRPLTRARRIVGALLVGLAVLALGPAGAWAHAVLLATTPEDGARLDPAPPAVELRFNEPVRPIAVRVLDAAGEAVHAPDAVSAADGVVRVALPPELEPGSYIVSYRVTSADGHPIGGSIVFGVGAAPAAMAAPPTDPVLPVVVTVNRALHYAALLAAVGGVLFLLLVLGRAHPLEDRLRGGLFGLILVAAVTAGLSVGLNGALLAGTAPASLVTAEPWSIGAGTSLSASAAAAVFGLLIVALGLVPRRRPRAAQAALALGSAVALASLALTGHAATASPRWLATASVLLHGLCAAFWLGSLWALAVVLRNLPAPEAAGIVRRFATLAVGAVVALVVAGLALSTLQIPPTADAVATDYGRLWLAKLALVALLLGLAALNRRILTPRLARGVAGAPVALRRSIGGELAVAAAILGVTALLGQTPPPALPSESEHHAHTHDHADTHDHDHRHNHGHVHGPGGAAEATAVTATTEDYTAEIEVRPAEPGLNRVEVQLSDADGRPLSPLEVTFELALPAAEIEPFTRPLEPVGEGRFAGEIEIPLAGDWAVRLDALITDFDKAILRAELPVAAAPVTPASATPR